jgi:hypothetical protein
MSEERETLTLADGAEEAVRLVDTLQQKGLAVRLLGGVAVRLRCPHATHRALNRVYADLDFVTYKRQARQVSAALTEQGYTADRRFNALHGERRLLFFDEPRNRQIDIFLGTFEMCHKLALEPRLTQHARTLSPADLLLTKLQIVQLNAKDIQDTLAILLDFVPQTATTQPGDDLDMKWIARLCAQDWGWFTTVNDNLEKIAQQAPSYIEAEEAALVAQRVASMRETLEQEPKTASWRVRSLVGKKMLWYELPEEVKR